MTYKIETNNFDYPLFLITIKEDKFLFSIENAEGKEVLSLVMPFTKAFIREWIKLLTKNEIQQTEFFIVDFSSIKVSDDACLVFAKFLIEWHGQIWQFIYKEGIFELAPEN